MPPESALGSPSGTTAADLDDDVKEDVPEVQPTLRDEIEAAVASAEDDAGEIVDRVKTPAEEPAPEKPEQKAEEGEQQAPEDAKYPNLTAERVKKAPEGWRPAAREGWDKLPPEVQREVHRRETDIQTGLNESADARRFSETFNKTIEPYKALIASEGAESPMAAVEHLMQTTATLKMGSPAQKAARISEIIQHYGVDLDELDSALAARISGNPQAPANDPVQQAIDQRMRPVEEFMTNMNGRIQETQQTHQQEIADTVDDFAKDAEFLEDVRLDMADLLSLASQRNRQMSLKQAYDLACKAHPEVSRVIARRSEQENQLGRRDHVAAKIAASNVSRAPNQVGTGTPAGAGSSDTVRGALLASIDQLENAE